MTDGTCAVGQDYRRTDGSHGRRQPGLHVLSGLEALARLTCVTA